MTNLPTQQTPEGLILWLLTEAREDTDSPAEIARVLQAQEFFELLLDCGDSDCTHPGCKSQCDGDTDMGFS